MKHELILEQLKIMGFYPVCIDDEKYLFEYKEIKFILTNPSFNIILSNRKEKIFDKYDPIKIAKFL